MKKLIFTAMLIVASVTVSMAQDPGWPRQKINSAGKLVFYQPQVDAWNNHTDLSFRMAFALTPTGGKPTLGVVTINAATDVNVDDRTVLIRNLAIKETHFPSLNSAKAEPLDKMVRTFLPADSSVTISLDRLVASVEKTQVPPTVDVRNDPPMIFVSNRPAMLIHLDGEPVFGKIKDTKLEFVVNSNFPLFINRSKSNYYLFTGKRWLMASSLQGPWTNTSSLPKDFSKVKQDQQWSGLAKAIPPPVSSEATPKVFYGSGPAEVIIFQGAPVYSKIPGTQLVYAANTDADLLVHSPSQQYYYLAAGRWFRASSLQGPWTFATPELPPDFANIPMNSPASRVLASVPGTEASKDAVLLAQIPTTVTVDPTAAAAQAKVTYLGPPEFKPIEGTNLSYAINTSDRVIKVGEVYYLCLQGIWFTSATPQGPWTTASSVPQVIYTIPPSSPVYNVTYVTQTTTSSGTIQAGYTAGYFGSFVVGIGVGVWLAGGTGYYYPPYFYYPVYGYPIYYPYAATYGVGAFYNPYTGAYGVARGVYGPYGGATGWAAYNPYTGTYARGGSVYGPYGSMSAGRAYNPYTGTGMATRQGSSPYGHWGTSVVTRGNQAVRTGHVTTGQGTIAGARSSTGAAVVGGSGARGSGGVARTSSGDLYAAKDGNIYRNTGDGWHKHENGSWSSVNRPSTASSSQPQMQSLQQEMQNRQRGAAQSRNFQNFQRSGGYGGGRSFGGGGFRGGGRRR